MVVWEEQEEKKKGHVGEDPRDKGRHSTRREGFLWLRVACVGVIAFSVRFNAYLKEICGFDKLDSYEGL